MPILNRVARLFRADFNAVLDNIEEPDLLLRQAVREMEEALAEDEHRLQCLRLETEQLAGRRAELETSLDRTREELEVCFDSDKEHLARALIKRRLELEHMCSHVDRRLEKLAADGESLRAQIDNDRGRLESMRQKAELLARRDVEDTGGWQGRDLAREFSVRDEDVEIALLREKQRRSGRRTSSGEPS